MPLLRGADCDLDLVEDIFDILEADGFFFCVIRTVVLELMDAIV